MKLSLMPIKEAQKLSSIPVDAVDPYRRQIEEEVKKAVNDHKLFIEVKLANVPFASRVVKKLRTEVVGQKGDKTGYQFYVKAVAASSEYGKYNVDVIVLWGAVGDLKPDILPSSLGEVWIARSEPLCATNSPTA